MISTSLQWTVSTGGLGISALQYSASQTGSGTLSVSGEGRVTDGFTLGSSPMAPEALTVSLSPSANLYVGGTTSVLNGSSLTVLGGSGTTYHNDGAIVTSGGSKLFFGSSFSGGTVTNSVVATGGGSTIEFGSAVSADTTIALNGVTLSSNPAMTFGGTTVHPSVPAKLQIDIPAAFKGQVNFKDAVLDLGMMTQALTWSEAGGVLSMYGAPTQGSPGGAVLAAIRFNDISVTHTGLSVVKNAAGHVLVNERGVFPQFGVALAHHVG
jgi:hypothetical protein